MFENFRGQPDPGTLPGGHIRMIPEGWPERKVPALDRPMRIDPAVTELDVEKDADTLPVRFLFLQGQPVVKTADVSSHNIDDGQLQAGSNGNYFPVIHPDMTGGPPAACAGACLARPGVKEEWKTLPALHCHLLPLISGRGNFRLRRYRLDR
jgi:hypothetical protein